MTNGNTGVADLLCGNWHMRQDWDYMMDSTSFSIRTPEDGLEQPIESAPDRQEPRSLLSTRRQWHRLTILGLRVSNSS